jgi:hypothetical protein
MPPFDSLRSTHERHATSYFDEEHPMSKISRFKMDRLEDRITPSYFQPSCGSSHKGSSKKSHKSSKKKSSKKSSKKKSSKKAKACKKK